MSFIEKLLHILERNGIQLSPDEIKLAEANFAMQHKGIIDEEWAIASVYAALKVSDCSAIPLRELVELFNKHYEEVNPLSYDHYAAHPSAKLSSRYDMRYIARCYNKILANQNQVPRPCNIQPTIYVKKYAEQLYLPSRALGYACRLSDEVVKKKLHRGRHPSVVAAVIIELTSEKFNLKLSKKEIADTTGCTYVSMINAKRALARAFH
jgi:hypothetical protein